MGGALFAPLYLHSHRHSRTSRPALTHSSSYPHITPHTYSLFVIPASDPRPRSSSFPRRRESIAPQGQIFVLFSHPTKIIIFQLFVISVTFHPPSSYSSYPHIAPHPHSHIRHTRIGPRKNYKFLALVILWLDHRTQVYSFF